MSTLVTTNLKHGGAASPNIVLTSGGDVTFGGDVTLGTSVLAAPTGDAPSYTCRAWVNFNGTGTVAVRASGNVTDITDGGTGTYTVNFTTAMPDVNYATQLSIDSGNRHNVSSPTTSNVTVVSYNTAGAVADITGIYVTVFR